MAINFKKKKDIQEENLETIDTYQTETSTEEKEPFNLLSILKAADAKVEDAAFGNLEAKLKLVAKVILYVFMAFTLVGVILTALLTSSLGGFGVLVALLLVAVFMFVGYAISTLIYGYASVVEKSKQAELDLSKLNFQPQVIEVKKVKKPIQIEDSEFPEF